MVQFQKDSQAGRVAELFSGQLASDETITEEFLPALKAFATCDWEKIFPVSIYLLAMLIHKKKNGLSLAMSALPTYVSATVILYRTPLTFVIQYGTPLRWTTLSHILCPL